MQHGRTDYDRIQDPEEKIPEDEPVFLLRGQDLLAGSLVREYARRLATHSHSREMIESIQRHADWMDDWAERHGKVPDAPEEALR